MSMAFVGTVPMTTTPTPTDTSVQARDVVSNAVRHHIPAGWYPDRQDARRRRWWNGSDWTEHYSAVPIGAVSGVTVPRHLAALALAEERIDTDEVAALLPASTNATTISTSRVAVPVIVTILIAALAGANAVLLSILAFGH